VAGETIYPPAMARREREILEHAVHAVAEQAAKADDLIDEAKAAGGGDHPVTVHAKMLRLELLKVKADLERARDASLDADPNSHGTQRPISPTEQRPP